MKTSRRFIIGAFGLLSAVILTSCTTAGDHSGCTACKMTHSSQAASPPAQVPLMEYYNVQGICADNAKFSGGVDGDGYECSSNVLGTEQTWNDVKFEIGSANAETNVISCGAQTIPLPPGKYSKLEFLGMAVNGAQASQNFTVLYAEPNSSQTFTQNVSDWAQPDNNSNESQAIDMPYRNNSDGTRDENEYYIYGYSFDLNKTSTVKSLELPDNNNVKIFAITLVP